MINWVELCELSVLLYFMPQENESQKLAWLIAAALKGQASFHSCFKWESASTTKLICVTFYFLVKNLIYMHNSDKYQHNMFICFSVQWYLCKIEILYFDGENKVQACSSRILHLSKSAKITTNTGQSQLNSTEKARLSETISQNQADSPNQNV